MMDQKQKDLLSSAPLAAAIDFEQVAQLLHLVKSVSKEKAEEIKTPQQIEMDLLSFQIMSIYAQQQSDNQHQAKVKTPISRNLKLLAALKESDSSTAFEDFIQILEITNSSAALKIVSEAGFNKQLSKGGNRDILRKAWNKFVDSKSPAQYPLGMYSGSSNSNPNASQVASAYMVYQGDSALSPLKEKHQATLITSGASSITHSTLDSGYSNGNKTSPTTLIINPTTPSLADNQNTNGANCIIRPKDFNLQQAYNDQTSQTPTRQHELNLMHNLSISDRQVEPNSDNQEPIVCWHPYAQPQSGPGSRASSPHLCHPSHLSSSSDSDSSSDSLHSIDPNIILDTNVTKALAREGTNMMSVKLASVCHNDPGKDYKMTARPRGPCLIVNNIDFEADMFPTRKGSDEDARRFDTIFQQLGFTVIMRRNQTADQMKKLFKEVAAQCKEEHDSLFVFILSHGSEHGIYGTDGIEVYLESEIISCFDNRNCSAMLGKPKVFVIQACRGRAKDCGGDGDMTDSIAWSPVVESASQENRVPPSWLPSSQPPHGKKRKHPIRTDMLLVFSCLAGFVSVRNELAGSWLGVALAYFIMTHAHDTDLLRILNLVTNDVIQRESSNGHIQSIELKLLGWTKDLYFNPGLYL